MSVMHGSRTPEKTARIIELCRMGLSLQQVAEFYGCTRERIRQIVTAHGVDKSQRGIAVKKRNKAA